MCGFIKRQRVAVYPAQGVFVAEIPGKDDQLDAVDATKSQLLALCGLIAKKECFGKWAFTANFKGSEILVPGAIGSFGLRFPPSLELIKVVCGDPALSYAIEEMVPQSRRKI